MSGHERTGPSSVGATMRYMDKGLLLYIYNVSHRYTSVHMTRMPVKFTAGSQIALFVLILFSSHFKSFTCLMFTRTRLPNDPSPLVYPTRHAFSTAHPPVDPLQRSTGPFITVVENYISQNVLL